MTHTDPTHVDRETLDAVYEQASAYGLAQGQDADGAGAYASWYCHTQQMTGRPVGEWAPHSEVYAAWQREIAAYYLRSSRQAAGHGHREDAARDRDRAVALAGRELVQQLEQEATD